MATYPIYTGLDNVLDGFKSLYRDGYTFSLWNGASGGRGDIILQYPYPDHAKGMQFFEDNITAFSQSGNDELFYLKFHPALKKDGFVDRKTATISSTPIRVNQIEGVEPGITGNLSRSDNPFKMYEAVAAVKNLPAQIEQVMTSRFTAYEERLTALEQGGPDEQDTGIVGQIGRLMENPHIAQAVPQLVNAAINFISQYLPKQPVMQEQQVSGTTEPKETGTVDEVVLNNALERLQYHCQLDSDLTLLADMAEKNPMMFKMMLQSLRSQKN